MKFKEKLENIIMVLKTTDSLIAGILSTVFISAIMFYFTYFEETYYNIGAYYAYLQTISQAVLALLFGINIALLYYKLKFMSQFNAKETNTTVLSGILGVIVSGCPACGITLASYVGLASFFASFPLLGMELKFVGIAILLFSINSLSKNLTSCDSKVKE